jgi:hypothetical protein
VSVANYKSATSVIGSAYSSAKASAAANHNSAIRPVAGLSGAAGMLVVAGGVLAGAWMTL